MLSSTNIRSFPAYQNLSWFMPLGLGDGQVVTETSTIVDATGDRVVDSGADAAIAVEHTP